MTRPQGSMKGPVTPYTPAKKSLTTTCTLRRFDAGYRTDVYQSAVLNPGGSRVQSRVAQQGLPEIQPNASRGDLHQVANNDDAGQADP